MHRAAKLQIAAEADGQVVKMAFALANRHHIQQRLGGVAVAAVTGVDDRDAAVPGRTQRCALLGVAHGGNIGHAADNADGIGDCLAFGCAGYTGIGETQYLAAQVQHSSLKRKAGAGARLIKQRRQPLAGGNVFVCGRVVVDTVGKVH